MQPSQAAVFSGRCDLVVPSSLCKEAAISRSWHVLCVCVTAVHAKLFHQQTDCCFSQGVGFGGAIRDVPILESNPGAVTESLAVFRALKTCAQPLAGLMQLGSVTQVCISTAG